MDALFMSLLVLFPLSLVVSAGLGFRTGTPVGRRIRLVSHEFYLRRRRVRFRVPFEVRQFPANPYNEREHKPGRRIKGRTRARVRATLGTANSP